MASTTVLDKIRKLILRDRYELTGHALEGVADNLFSEEDIECAVLHGEIRKCEDDERSEAVDGKKYTICGCGDSCQEFEVVGKIVKDEMGRLFLVITAYQRGEA